MSVNVSPSPYVELLRRSEPRLALACARSGRHAAWHACVRLRCAGLDQFPLELRQSAQDRQQEASVRWGGQCAKQATIASAMIMTFCTIDRSNSPSGFRSTVTTRAAINMESKK
jgi:hypothetical protein